MNYDIASELSTMFDLSRKIPSLTLAFIAASGILLICFGVGIVLMTKHKVGLRFLPVLYGSTAYLLFYVMIGSFFSGLLSMTISENANTAVTAIMRIVILIVTSSLIVGGRFFAMWFIRKYYSDYCDACGIGVGVSLTEAIINGITIFLNYSLCVTLNSSGLETFVNSYDTVEEAAAQLSSIWFFYENPSYTYIFSGFESIMFMLFNTFISVMFYAIWTGRLKKTHLLSVVGIQALIYLPSSLYSSGVLFNNVGCFITEVLIFAGTTLLFFKMHKTYFKDVTPPVNTKNGKNSSSSSKSSKKMPDFNKNINK